MASLIIGAGALAYGSIKSHREKKKARREHNDARFAELERENATRIERLERPRCFCHEDGSHRQDCEIHGHNSHQDQEVHAVNDGEGVDTDPAPAYQDQRLESQITGPEIHGEGKLEEDVEKINEERRLRMKSGAFTNWRLRRKQKDSDRVEKDDAVVR